MLYLLLSTATFAMLLTIAQYLSFRHDIGFLLMKQGYINNDVWRIAFYVHVFSSIFSLCAGFTQFSNSVLQVYKKLHKLVGKLYVYDILLINFPAGMIMAIYANGEIQSKLAFIMLDCLWFWYTYKAVVFIRKGDVVNHKNYMIRSYALTCSAITLRTWKIIFTHTLTIDPSLLYMIDAWMGFVPNLLFAEWLIRKKKLFR